ncbi:hypothetical protein Tco_0140416 [Tanacetum coccineum]
MSNTRSGVSMTYEEIEHLVSRRVAKEMEAREAVMNLEPLNESGDEQEGFMLVARECTFQDFLKCKPHNFSRTEGVVGLTHWFEKMKTVFNISNYPSKYQVKYVTCTLQDSALTWWNSHKRKIGVDVAYAMKWARLMKLMTEELILLCNRMVPDEEDIVERFIGGLPDNIQGDGYAARSAENKRRMESNPRDNHGQQPPFKRQNVSGQNVARAYTARNNEKRGYAAAISNMQRAPFGNQQGVICYECGRPGHASNNEATIRAYAIGRGGANPDSNVVTGTFLLNNYYASMLFDSGIDRSFVSSTLSDLLDVAPSTLDTSYAVDLADGRIFETSIILKGCTLGLLPHPFDIDLMPVELGSFDVIIDKVLIIQSDDIDGRSKSKLNIISCTKTQKYIEKGCQVYLVQVMSKKEEDKSEEKRLEDVPIVQNYPKVFPEELPGQPPTRQVEF